MASPFERAFNPAFQQASAAAMKSLDDERQENRFQQRMLEQRQYDASLLEGSKAYAANLLKDSNKIVQDRIDAATKLADARTDADRKNLLKDKEAQDVATLTTSLYAIGMQPDIVSAVLHSEGVSGLRGLLAQGNAEQSQADSDWAVGGLPSERSFNEETPYGKAFRAAQTKHAGESASSASRVNEARESASETAAINLESREQEQRKQNIQSSVQNTEKLKELERAFSIPEGETIDWLLGQSAESVRARVEERAREAVERGKSSDDSRKVIGAVLGDNALKLGANQGSHLLWTADGGVDYKNAAIMARYIKRIRVPIGNNDPAGGAFNGPVTYKWEEEWVPPSLEWVKSGRKIETLQDFIDSRDESKRWDSQNETPPVNEEKVVPRPQPLPLPKAEGRKVANGPDTEKWASKAFRLLTGGTPDEVKPRFLGRPAPVPAHRGIGELRRMERVMPQGEPLPSLPGKDAANKTLDEAMGRANIKIAAIEAELLGVTNLVAREQKFLEIGRLLKELENLKNARESKE